MKKIVILFGGKSSEYEVSLASAYAVLSNIDKNKYEIYRVGITREGEFYLFMGDDSKIADGTWEDGEIFPISLDLNSRSLLVYSGEEVIRTIEDFGVFPVLHGKNCEDGTLQGMLEASRIPFVGSGCASSAVCMDKAFTKSIISQETGIRQAKAIIIKKSEGESSSTDELRKKCEGEIGYPMFIKPARGGSSVGASKVKSEGDFASALSAALGEDSKVLVEECITGREIEVAVLEENGHYTVARPAEIDVGTSEFYDYETKYISDVSSYHIPARIPKEKEDEIRIFAREIFDTLDCKGFARVDFFYTESGEIIFNEINTIPGFTPISMFPKMMINYGIPYGELIDRLIEASI